MSNELLEFLGIDEIKPRVRSTEVPIVYKDTLKKRRDRKEDRDFVDKKELYDALVAYKGMCYNDKEKGKVSKERKELRDFLMLHYIEIAKKLMNHTHFRNYDENKKSDLLQEALLDALSIGKDTKHPRYGVEYFARFNHEKYDNVFAFWTQQIKNFFYKFLKWEYKYINTKWESLEMFKDQYQYNCINIWDCPSAQFHYGDVIDYD